MTSRFSMPGHCSLLALACSLALAACGGGGEDSTNSSQSATGANGSGNQNGSSDETSRKTALQVGSHITVTARGTLAQNEGPWMQVLANGNVIGSVQVRSPEFTEYNFASASLLPSGTPIDVVFTNDAYINGQDRNLYVQSVNIDGKQISPNAPGVTYDRGAIDGVDVVAGQEEMQFTGALRFASSSNHRLVIRARASMAANVGPFMEVWLNGQKFAQALVVNTEFDDISFNFPDNLPANSQVQLVFTNDAFINGEDRNLYVESIRVGGTTIASSAVGVTYDRGAVDGVDVIQGQTEMLWNGALTFTLPQEPSDPIAGSGDALPAGYSLCANEWQDCSFGGTANVIYGGAGKWSTPRSFTNSVSCTNAVFGDPAPGVQKACYLAASTDPHDPMESKFKPLTTGFGPGLDQAYVYPTNEIAGASNDGTGNFRTSCQPVKMGFVDPIVTPGQVGAAHLHVFFGNTGVNESSTNDSLRASGKSACRGGIVNRSSYWVSAMIDTRTNVAVMPEESVFYYKSAYNGIQPQNIVPFPPGLRMIAGNNKHTSPYQPYGVNTAGYRFKCHDAGGAYPSMPNCAVGDAVEQEIAFPQCWDGVNVDSPDHKSHMAYGTGSGCPSSHPVALPEVSYHILYRVTEANQATHWRLSSDRDQDPAGNSSHGDWMNGWDVSIMKTFVDNCINRGLDCHAHLLGDGRALGGL